jgi:Ser/Thr protein kinase RdoA (MazF antagonist)
MRIAGAAEPPFDSLSGRDKAIRLRAAVRPALAAWGLEAATVETVGFDSNASYRVGSTGQAWFFLKIHDPSGCHPSEELDSISAWQNTLTCETGYRVPHVLPALSGALHSEITHRGVPGARVCTLEEWMPGRKVGDGGGRGFTRKLGRVQALMHARSGSADPGIGRGCRRFDRVFPWSRGPEGFCEEVLLFDIGRIPELDSVTCRLFEEAASIVQAGIDSLFGRDSGPVMIHCDMHPSNIRLCGGEPVILDFEDSMMGFPEQDIAVSLYYSRFRGGGEGLFEEFASGYETVSPWPFEDAFLLETLIAGRALLLANFVLAMKGPTGMELSREYIPLIADRIRGFLESTA